MLADHFVRRFAAENDKIIQGFTEAVGVPPKLFLRLQRFERLRAGIFPERHVDWCETAQRYGYYDQPHMIRDFHAFAGMTPSAYLATRGPADHHSAALA